MPNNITSLLKTISGNQDQLQIAFPHKSYSNLFKKYLQIIFSITYKEMYVNPNNFNEFYSRNWKQHIIFIDKLVQSILVLEVENYNVTKDGTAFLFTDEVDLNFINGKKFYIDQTIIRGDNVVSNYDYLAAISIRKSELGVQTLIKYTSLTDIISLFGGSFQIFVFMFQGVMYMIINYFYYPNLINKIFKFHTLDESEDKGKIYMEENLKQKNLSKNYKSILVKTVLQNGLENKNKNNINNIFGPPFSQKNSEINIEKIAKNDFLKEKVAIENFNQLSKTNNLQSGDVSPINNSNNNNHNSNLIQINNMLPSENVKNIELPFVNKRKIKFQKNI